MTNHTVTFRAVYTVTIDGVEHQLKRSAGAWLHPKTGKVVAPAPEQVRDEDRDLSRRINLNIEHGLINDNTDAILNAIWEMTD